MEFDPKLLYPMGHSKIFTPLHDAIIKAEYKRHGEAAFETLSLQWNFSTTRIKNRYEGYLKPASNEPWTDEDDARLLKVAAQFNRQWGNVRLSFPKRTNVELRNRYIFLQRKPKDDQPLIFKLCMDDTIFEDFLNTFIF